MKTNISSNKQIGSAMNTYLGDVKLLLKKLSASIDSGCPEINANLSTENQKYKWELNYKNGSKNLSVTREGSAAYHVIHDAVESLFGLINTPIVAKLN
jgi:hypothetical protein